MSVPETDNSSSGRQQKAMDISFSFSQDLDMWPDFTDSLIMNIIYVLTGTYSMLIRYLYSSLFVDRIMVVVESNVLSNVSIDFMKTYKFFEAAD